MDHSSYLHNPFVNWDEIFCGINTLDVVANTLRCEAADKLGIKAEKFYESVLEQPALKDIVKLAQNSPIPRHKEFNQALQNIDNLIAVRSIMDKYGDPSVSETVFEKAFDVLATCRQNLEYEFLLLLNHYDPSSSHGKEARERTTQFIQDTEKLYRDNLGLEPVNPRGQPTFSWASSLSSQEEFDAYQSQIPWHRVLDKTASPIIQMAIAYALGDFTQYVHQVNSTGEAITPTLQSQVQIQNLSAGMPQHLSAQRQIENLLTIQCVIQKYGEEQNANLIALLVKPRLEKAVGDFAKELESAMYDKDHSKTHRNAALELAVNFGQEYEAALRNNLGFPPLQRERA